MLVSSIGYLRKNTNAQILCSNDHNKKSSINLTNQGSNENNLGENKDNTSVFHRLFSFFNSDKSVQNQKSINFVA